MSKVKDFILSDFCFVDEDNKHFDIIIEALEGLISQEGIEMDGGLINAYELTEFERDNRYSYVGYVEWRTEKVWKSAYVYYDEFKRSCSFDCLGETTPFIRKGLFSIRKELSEKYATSHNEEDLKMLANYSLFDFYYDNKFVDYDEFFLDEKLGFFDMFLLTLGDTFYGIYYENVSHREYEDKPIPTFEEFYKGLRQAIAKAVETMSDNCDELDLRYGDYGVSIPQTKDDYKKIYEDVKGFFALGDCFCLDVYENCKELNKADYSGFSYCYNNAESTQTTEKNEKFKVMVTLWHDEMLCPRVENRKIVEFDTREEADAYIKGLNDAIGWDSVRIVDNQSEIAELCK